MKDKLQPKVLVIDDDTAVRGSFRHYLEDLGYVVAEATDGRDGLDRFTLDPADIVLVDLRMPEVGGLQVLETLSKESPDTPLIVISGTGQIGDAIAAIRLGAWDYLLKPLPDLSILGHSIAKALERARLLHENRDYQEHLEQEVERRTKDLTGKMEEMARFNRMAIGRERRVIELKRQINTLLVELGREPKYGSPDLLEQDSVHSG